eukprot:362156-Chlamydomonas_euryale.AAC.21
MIVGAGYAGVELAVVVAERLKGAAAIQLVTPGASVLEGCPAGQRKAAETALAELGVDVLCRTKVEKMSAPGSEGALPHATSVSLLEETGAREQETALVLWTAGSSPTTKAAEGRKGIPFPINERGAIQTVSRSHAELPTGAQGCPLVHAAAVCMSKERLWWRGKE